MNIIEKILDKERSFVEGIQVRNKHNRILSKQRTEQNEEASHLKEISDEFTGLLSTAKYKYFIEFITGIENLLFEQLKYVCLNSKGKDEQVLMAARISAKIELLSMLREEPARIVREAVKK